MKKNQNDLIKKLIKRGFVVIPIPYMQKSPVIKNWTKYEPTKENIDRDFPPNKPMNVGVLNGKPSGNLADIDIDHKTALEFAERYLPKTDMVFGRKSKPSSHYIYKCPELPKTQKFQSSDGCIIEIRSTGTQTVFPPSTHTSGEEIRFEKDGEPATVDKNILEQACRIITVGTILVEHYPEEGLRNEFALALSAIALRLFDGDVKEAKRFVLKVATLAQDEEAQSRSDVVDYTADRMKRGQPTVGIPTLADLIGEEAAKDIARYVPSEFEQAQFDDIVTEVNKKYAFVMVQPSYAILKEIMTPDGYISYELFHERAFQAEMAPHKVGKKSFAKIWMESPKRRKYDGIEFRPQNPSNNKYNTFRGFAAKPIKGDCSLILSHIKDIVCCGNEEYYAYWMAWFANIIQEPENKCGTCIILRGGQGCGKTTAIQMFGQLFGPHFKVANNDRYLANRFNGHFQDCLLFNAEEAFFAGSKSLVSILKDIITGHTLMIEEKGLKPFKADNFVRIIVSTNEKWAINAGPHERRYFILDVSGEKANNAEYFNALWHQYDNGGRDALMYHLMHLDYSKIDLRKIPKTEALLEQKIHSMDIKEKWWFEVLNRGSLSEDVQGWLTQCGTADVFESYERFASYNRYSYKSIATQIGAFLKVVHPTLVKQRGVYKGIDFMGDATDKKKGIYYTFPPLNECRADFEAYIGQKIEWD